MYQKLISIQSSMSVPFLMTKERIWPTVSSELELRPSCDSLETLLLTPIYQSESQKISAKWVSWQQHKKKIKNDLSVSIYALLMSQP